MYINPILYSYSTQKYQLIDKDYEKIKSKLKVQEPKEEKDSSIFVINTKRDSKDLVDYIHENSLENNNEITSGIPIVGKVSEVVDKIKDNDYIPASGIASLALLNGPEDVREIFSAYEQIKALAQNKEFKKSYDYKKAQHPFSFFRGTLLNDYLNPFSNKCKHPKLASFLLKFDKTLMDTELGSWVLDKFNIEVDEIMTTENSIYHTEKKPRFLKAQVYTSPNKFGSLTARAMLRTPLIGLSFSSAMEMAHLAKEVKEGDNFFKELGKSTFRLASSTAITGYLGAVGSKYGPTGSIIGMGLSTVLNSKIEKLTD